MKIIDKINKLLEDNTTFFSFEYFPPRTNEGVDNLFTRIDSMGQLNPVFIDVTWGAGGSTSERTLDIVQTAQKYLGLETMMHLTCTNISREEIYKALTKAKDAGIQNILALRGDPPRGEEVWKEQEGGFAHASDLVRFIRENWGDYFGIAVAGYPEMHTDSKSLDEDLKHLKEKVDAGADFIVTQLFYDTSLFLKFVKNCREYGITCPIIPGIMPIHTFAGFSRMTTLCKTQVPQHITDNLNAIKDNDEAVKDYGVELAVEMCQQLIRGGVYGFHFYTLNLEKSVTRIVEGLGFLTKSRAFPWRASLEKGRVKEEVRPVFWQHRHKSYIKRTESWDDFPNGRWGDSRSPAYGELSDYHIGVYTNLKDEKAGWVKALDSYEDLKAVFVDYCKGDIQSLPWNDLGLSEESNSLKNFLLLLNSNGFLTINSQPAVNGVPSTHPVYGWGGPSGWVYQKAYVEFFVSEETLQRLLERISQKKYSYLTYHAVNAEGDKSYTNTTSTNALTWGVFPGSEIKQPTVVDSTSFLVWKDEAFALWKHWGSKYPEGSNSRKIINEVESTWFLMNIVDNDFTDSKLFTFFEAELKTLEH